jgi:nitric-oxide synthase
MSHETILRCCELFKGLREDELKSVLETCEESDVPSGEVILTEGEPAKGMYIIMDGTVQIYTTDRHGGEGVLAKLGAGTQFGEQSLRLDRAPLRSASVRADGLVKVFFIPAKPFQSLLRQDSPIKSRIASMGEAQVHQNLAHQSKLFTALRSSEARWHRERTFGDGEVVFHEGKPGDKFYVILSGSAGVYRNEGGQAKLLVQLREGQCFGELALINQKPRTATVLAHGMLKTMEVDGEHFLALHKASPEIQEHMQTLSKVYMLKGRGLTTQHAGRFMDRESILTLYHLPDGRTIAASQVIGEPLYNIGVVNRPGNLRTICFSNADGKRELMVDEGGQIFALTVQGPWDGLAEVHNQLFDGITLSPWDISVFESLGTLHLEQGVSFDEDDEVICVCLKVSRGALCNAIKGGCTSAACLKKETGAGTVCGSCTPRLHDMVGHEDWTPAEFVREVPITEDICSFRFRPWKEKLRPMFPGQHILIKVHIDGHWVQRSYTLTSTEANDYYEITVKRESQGLFSSWLFDYRSDEDLIGISSPQGSFLWDVDTEPEVICIVGGIGMTPALSMARYMSTHASKRRLHVEYCVSRADHFAYLDEFKTIAAETPGMTFTSRVTASEGRLDRNRLRVLGETFQDPVYFVCGPDAFQDDLSAILRGLGVPDKNVRTETFIPAGGSTPGNIEECPVPHPPQSMLEIPPVDVDDDPDLVTQAKAFLYQFYHEKGVPDAYEVRLDHVREEIKRTGTYEHTYDELAYGAKLAWRNAPRCIGRLFWSGLQVRDMRHLGSEEELFEAVLDHIRLATNKGNIRTLMTVFAPRKNGEEGIKIWNEMFIGYAAYRQDDGTVLGDSANLEMTEQCLKYGWKGGAGTPFDILPLLIQLPGREPRLFELPPELVMEVDIEHPQYSALGELNLKWFVLPVPSRLILNIGGVEYTAAPFSGWYTAPEIAARDFTDEGRYNKLYEVGEKLGFDTSRERNLWRDSVGVELNRAVLHSFDKRGVKIVDHHAASRQFMQFAEQEEACGREVSANWKWIVPATSPSMTEVFHVNWKEQNLLPALLYAPAPWQGGEG